MPVSQKNTGLIENLVTQFSSPLDCFRELAQNAMDAGSQVVEVWSEFIPGDDYIGTIALHVDDFGEGMDEHIIDTYLTQLFSSAKEDDLTKIGKFGIGFVSVFALEPRAVLVQTGRGGEYWEVLFHEDRTFTKTRVQMPVEGTQITLFLAGDIQRYNELVQGTRERLKFWCAHSETEITFEDRSQNTDAFAEPERINQPFGVEGSCVTRVEHQGTEIVCAYQRRPSYGFYNAGLTLAYSQIGEDLLGARAARFRHIGFKIKSRYLEHTLSRDTIMRDANYDKAMRLLEDAVNQDLFGALVAQLESLVAEDGWAFEQMQAYGELCNYLAREPAELLKSIGGRRVIRGLNGSALSLDELYDAWADSGRVLVSEQPSELCAALERAGSLVVYGRGEGGTAAASPLDAVNRLVDRFVRLRYRDTLGSKIRSALKVFGVSNATPSVLVAPEDIYLPVVLDASPPEVVRGLIAHASRILRDAGAGYRRMTTCQIGWSAGDEQLFVVGNKLSSFMARPPVGAARGTRSLEAAVNRDHPHFTYLLEVYQSQPELAAYCLAKSLLLSQDRLPSCDMSMIEAAQA
ncbi:histidine kinase/DNA gyrase B/HSP90-like ATPase [Bradymonas sediminis]|uniref:Uncharacterized protein n=1 Tax=Bradymonas sediminis TaxID=1548548 RepID=A0A2Z4FHB0_9DELT|nr:hypothetical protein DN745_01800 [Bradymonas sediminis]TDP77256.1 histidine kinase/DNA gyrase B/HSP90-like ATPase [Bradymonas sediminis]